MAGNAIPSDGVWLHPESIGTISTSFQNITRALGTPSSTYVFVPRSRSDYWKGYWDGFGDGYSAARAYTRHPALVANFHYGHYFSDPSWLGFYHPGYYASVYHYWGWSPGWIHPSRVYSDPVDYIHIPPRLHACDYTADYGVDYVGAERVILAIRRAWSNSAIRSLSSCLNDDVDIHINFDGEYAYTISADDYYAMTADIMATTHTAEIRFDDPIWLSTHEVIYSGSQSFYDPEGGLQTTCVSYRLRLLDSGWTLVAVGSSLDPIDPGYPDFRHG